ncbi:MAG: VWA domain-containing protein [Acidobacteriaceae bacterium]|nr:VWA domain-containing protein [Acidobacteriaceae bacterium]MBV9765533.1 VWA domain-containing protein [Acidobacteriaceae bacterium]
MFFLNLTAAEFFTLLTALGGLITALYLLDRTKRKKVVSTLRFWTPALTAEERQSRRRMREPWSLVLQLVSLLLLLLALAQLQWGNRNRHIRDHVLLLDTSSASAERTDTGTLLNREKAAARQYLQALPSRDRVTLVRVDALSTPVTSFTADRTELVHALEASDPGFSALNIEQALSFARQARTWSAANQGEIVYVGPKLVSERESASSNLTRLRLIAVPARRENCGILRIDIKRSDQNGISWQAVVALKNYASHPKTIRLKTAFAQTAFRKRGFTLAPQEEKTAEYNFATNIAGQFSAEISPDDDLSTNHRAILDLPAVAPLTAAVYTARPDVLRPLLEANHRLSVKYFSPSEYQPKPAASVMILDQMAVRDEPKISALWIQPVKEYSPLPVKTVVADSIIKNWHTETTLGAGLHVKEIRVPTAEVFQTFEGDVPVASLAEGPTVVGRSSNENHPKIAVIGFDPLSDPLRFQVTTPLLFANLLEWLAPESFRTIDRNAGHVGLSTVTLDPGETKEHIRVLDENGFALPFTVRNETLQLFASRPSIVHILSNTRERVLSLTLPEIPNFEWNPPSNAITGLPAPSSFSPPAIDLWKWLAALGAFGLFLEWMLFGRRRIFRSRGSKPQSPRTHRPQPQTELVSR